MTVLSYAIPRWHDLRALIGLAVPVVTVQLGFMTMGLVDTIMVGHLSSQALAAVALGNIFVFSTCSLGMGVLLALDPLVAQAVGSNDRHAISMSVQRGLIVAFLLSIPTSLVLLPGESLFDLLGQPDSVVPISSGYARICIPSVIAFFFFVVLRQSLQAMERVWPIVVAMVGANLVNVLLNWLLVFGKLGLPRMGAIGSAWATTASRWFLLISLLMLAWQELVPILQRFDRGAFRLQPLLRMVRLGLPIGFHMLLEYLAFAVIGLLMGWLGTVDMAAHQVALNLAAFTYMVPLGVSAAAAVRVGQAVGADDQAGTQRAAFASLLCGAAFMATSALVFLGLPYQLAARFTNIGEVCALAATLIPIAGFFQVFDGLQVVAAGVLRGLGDTRAPLVVGLIGFWLIGLPTSLGLGFGLEWGATGLWWGFVAGLGAVAVFLLLRVGVLLRRRIARVVIE
jgi:MATE family multidrug resistance protein